MTFEPRRVPPGTVVDFTGRNGEQITMRAETLEGDAAYGYITPADAQQDEVLAGFGYPVARKAIAAEAEAAEQAEKAPARRRAGGEG